MPNTDPITNSISSALQTLEASKLRRGQKANSWPSVKAWGEESTFNVPITSSKPSTRSTGGDTWVTGPLVSYTVPRGEAEEIRQQKQRDASNPFRNGISREFQSQQAPSLAPASNNRPSEAKMFQLYQNELKDPWALEDGIKAFNQPTKFSKKKVLKEFEQQFFDNLSRPR